MCGNTVGLALAAESVTQGITCLEREAGMATSEKPNAGVSGAVMVVGGGIAGMQSALDLAESGYYVYLLERETAIGGLMSQIDKTFPTNDCAM